MPDQQLSPAEVIQRIAEQSQVFAWQAGVGGMETAGSIVSFLAKHPDKIEAFLSGTESIMDWPMGWHEHGLLTWHGQNGKIYSPEWVRRQRTINHMQAQQQEPK